MLHGVPYAGSVWAEISMFFHPNEPREAHRIRPGGGIWLSSQPDLHEAGLPQLLTA